VPTVTKDEVGNFVWNRIKPPGYFAPKSAFNPKTSLLDVILHQDSS